MAVAIAWTEAFLARAETSFWGRGSLGADSASSARRGMKGSRSVGPSSVGCTRSLAISSVRREGWTAPGGTGQGSPGRASVPMNSDDTQTPLTGSAGWEAYHATACVLYPFWLRMFQIALVVREVLLDIRTPSPPGTGSMNPWIPCLSGSLPVAIDVQRM